MRKNTAATMTIEVHKPELKALIIQRMQSGRFQNVEDALIHALAASSPPEAKPTSKRTGADLIAAMQSSPYRELEIEPARYRLPVREVTF